MCFVSYFKWRRRTVILREKIIEKHNAHPLNKIFGQCARTIIKNDTNLKAINKYLKIL